MKILISFLVLAMVALALFPIKTVQADIYRWTDKNGQRHLTNDLGEIPFPYRKQAIEDLEERRATPEGSLSFIQDTPVDESVSSPDENEIPTDERPGMNSEAYWKNRVGETKAKLLKAQTELAEVNRKQIQNLELRLPDMQQNLQDLAAQEKKLRAQISYLEDELYEDIPNEARQAGIPPGWLRDAGLNQ